MGRLATTNGPAFAIPLNPIQAGTGVWQRIGAKVQLKHLSVRVSVIPLAVTTEAPPDRGRIMLVWDKQPNGTTFDPIQVLGGWAYNNTTVESRDSDIDPSYWGRFEILGEKFFSTPEIQPWINGAVTQRVISPIADDWATHEFQICLEGKETIFKGDPTWDSTPPLNLSQQIITGGIYLLGMGVTDGSANPYKWFVKGNAQVYFKDCQSPPQEYPAATGLSKQ